ncbi:insulinase family protein [Roseomonas sp. NAR14]|uniref:Insulinase family protein n=1 Tax=Roseomonas acroporae TaxID=2937791 RepID=A0A9X1Y8G9_9PROT|nr:pitrilysin family protein [Roseomonas acroporae]MCK8784175.1 insulinase family protein [Roseomonas acroporae]
MPRLTRRETLRTATLGAAAAATGLPNGAAEPRAASAAEAMPDQPLFGAQLWQLPNGLRVAFVESRRAPVVAQYLFYGAGAGEDPPGRSGTAHFLEHMMFKGSRRVATGAFSLAVAREGGNDNAFTSRDVTAYHQHVEASRLQLVASMEADRMAAPLIPPETVEPERLVVLEERRLRTDSNPRARFREAFDAALWGPQHWHGRPVIGWEDEIRAITRDDLLAFHARWYAPANAVLAIAGDVREGELRRIVEAEYGAVPARPEGASLGRRDRAAPVLRPADAPPARLVRHDPGVREAAHIRSWMAPSLTATLPTPGPMPGGGTLGSEHAYPLEVLAKVLGGGQGSRLHRALVETGLVVAAGASYDSDVVGAGEFGLYATPQRDTPPARLEQEMAATVDRVLQDGVTEAEVARGIRQLTAGALLALDSLGAAPRMIGDALASGLPIEAVEHWPARLRAVTAGQVTAAARAVFGHAQDASGWLLPEGAAAPPERAPGLAAARAGQPI